MRQIPYKRAVDGVIAFLSNETAKITSMRDRFLMFGALGAIKANPDAVVNTYRQYLEMVGILQGDMVDIDAVKGALVSAFANVPSFDALGFTFTESDVGSLLRHMEE